MSLTREAGGAAPEKRPETSAKRSQASRRPSKPGLRSMVKLARWRTRQVWRLLLVLGIGMTLAVMLVCSMPLYSDVSMTAGIRSVLGNSFQNRDIIVQSITEQISGKIVDQATKQIDADFQSRLEPYLTPLEFSVETATFTILGNQPNPKCSGNETGPIYDTCNQIQMIGASMAQAQSHLTLLAGRLPRTDSSDIEIALTSESAEKLNATVGSVFSIHVGFSQIGVRSVVKTFHLRLVGIFQLNRQDDPYWHGNTYLSADRGITPGFVFTALASNDGVISAYDKVFSRPDLSGTTMDFPAAYLWYYPLNPQRIDVDHLDSVLNGINAVQVDTSNNPYLSQTPYLEKTTTYLPSTILQRYHDRLGVARIPVTSLLIFVLALVLFFVSMMADFLVDRQTDAISVLRSRGASKSQIFGAFTVQSIALGIMAFVAGPLLAIVVVYFVGQRLLPGGDQNALSIIASNPLGVALNLAIYALITVIVSVLAMVGSIYRALQVDVLALRREEARSTRKPLWQRLILDIVAIIIALVGFLITNYVANSGLLDPQLRLILLSPLTLLGTVFLLIACLLVFLRIFQLLLRLGAWIATRGRGSASMLALAQMARSPRQSLRMTLLFSLATAFVIFTMIYSASQAQRIPQVAAYQAGADFSGTPENTSIDSVALDSTTTAYRAIPGVVSASMGYKGTAIGGGNIIALTIGVIAVDANNFAQTADWSEQDSTQSLSSLMAQLRAARSRSVAANRVPALVDENTWNALHLSPGAVFVLNFSPYGDLTMVAVAEVQHIPTSNNANEGEDLPDGNVLVDYRTLAPVYINNFAYEGVGMPLNYVWLKTRDDPASLGSVRKTLGGGCCLELSRLYDRRDIINSLQNDPLYVDLLGVMGIGASSKQLASILTWEQSIIYLTSLLLGLLFGAILSLLALPALVFTNAGSSGTQSNVTSSSFFVAQTVPPVQIVIPPALLLVLAILIVICVAALTLMVRVVSRPSISQTLRLNED